MILLWYIFWIFSVVSMYQLLYQHLFSVHWFFLINQFFPTIHSHFVLVILVCSVIQTLLFQSSCIQLGTYIYSSTGSSLSCCCDIKRHLSMPACFLVPCATHLPLALCLAGDSFFLVLLLVIPGHWWPVMNLIAHWLIGWPSELTGLVVLVGGRLFLF